MTQTLQSPVPLAQIRTDRGRPRLNPQVCWSLTGIAILLVIWTAVALAGLEERRVLPSPLSILNSFIDSRDVIVANLPQTAATAATGFAWGAGLAITVGLAAVLSRLIESVVVRTAIIADSLPTIALAPILMIVATGNTPGVVMAAIFVFFLTVMSFVAGLRQASPQSLEMNRAFGGGALSELCKIRLRYAIPSLLSGLMLSAPAAVLGALMSEFLIMGQGLGGALIAAQEALAVERVWAISIVCALMSGLFFALIGRARRVAAPWLTDQSQEYRVDRNSDHAGVLGAAASAVVAFVVVVGFWYGAIRIFGLNSYFAKTPADVWTYLFGSEASAANRTEILGYLASTSAKAFAGLAVGTVVALALSLVVMSFWRVDAALTPIVVGFRAIPLLALIPLISLLVSNGYVTAVIVAAILAFFATFVNVVQAAPCVPKDIIQLGEAYNATPLTMRWKVHRYYVIPAIFTSLKITGPAALIGAMSAEWLATGDGIGHLMIQAAMESRYTTMWSSFVVLTVFSVSLYACINAAEKAVARRLR
ncbi:ABC transporter permease subunit [Williamsia sp. 1135]|uniref:ABC transporter permease n=1 Tax=Williamsia sp. 1135 TaxID=1889262 RepID=UPI000A0FB866|nr:ABC transporter permease subunit [Williamsia sp. 1135]ORM32171.1 hypothetical protein BFL43_16470 [Williamsia sp. 1135]